MTTGTARVEDYKDLLVWKKAFGVVQSVYRITAGFPDVEKFGLTSQMRRAAVSMPSNIAEGQTRHSTGEFIQFLSHAEGSAAELETQLLLSIELGYCAAADIKATLDSLTEVRKMLGALRRKLRSR